MVSLTVAGEHLRDVAVNILSEMDAVRAVLRNLAESGVSRLRVGATTTACQYLLPPVLRELKQRFPKCQISIEPADSPGLVEALRSNRIEMAITLEPKPDDQLQFDPFFTDELQFVVGPHHPWGLQGRVSRGAIGEQNLILYNRTSYTFSLIEKYFAEEGVSLKHCMELGNMEAIKELVKLGQGISVVAPWIVRKEAVEGSLVVLPLGRRKLRRTWGLLRWRSRALNSVDEAFGDLCRSVMMSMGCRAGDDESAQASV